MSSRSAKRLRMFFLIWNARYELFAYLLPAEETVVKRARNRRWRAVIVFWLISGGSGMSSPSICISEQNSGFRGHICWTELFFFMF